jgi:hypothetical protein
MIIFVFILLIYLVYFIFQKMKNLKQKNMTLGLIRSIKSFKYHSLMQQCEPDEECSICCAEYGAEEIVCRLNCNPRHIFHKECLVNWIKIGSNSCPICRAIIDHPALI